MPAAISAAAPRRWRARPSAQRISCSSPPDLQPRADDALASSTRRARSEPARAACTRPPRAARHTMSSSSRARQHRERAGHVDATAARADAADMRSPRCAAPSRASARRGAPARRGHRGSGRRRRPCRAGRRAGRRAARRARRARAPARRRPAGPAPTTTTSHCEGTIRIDTRRNDSAPIVGSYHRRAESGPEGDACREIRSRCCSRGRAPMPLAAAAQAISGMKVEPAEATPGVPVKITVSGAPTGDTANCGLRLHFGDGRDARLQDHRRRDAAAGGRAATPRPAATP